MTRAVAFDLDGTLVDTPTGIVETFTAVLAALDVAPVDRAAIRATIGLPLERAFATLLERPVDDERVAHAARLYQPVFRERVLPRARALVFPGVADGLAALQARGLALAVATSKYHASAGALLAAAGLRDRFAIIVGADQVAQPKPAPEMLHHILGALALPAEQLVMVGDTTHDLAMARAAGVRALAVTYGVHDRRQLTAAGPTWVADSFPQIVHQLTAQRPSPQHSPSPCREIP